MILWKSGQISEVEDQDTLKRYIQSGEITDNNDGTFTARVCDLSSFSPQVFVGVCLGFKPSEDHPELMGCDWVTINPETIYGVKFTQTTIEYCIALINCSNSPKMKREGESLYLVFDPNEIILSIHEHEISLATLMKSKELKQYKRLDKHLLDSEPYIDRLDMLVFFLDMCYKNESIYSVEYDDKFDQYIADRIFCHE